MSSRHSLLSAAIRAARAAGRAQAAAQRRQVAEAARRERERVREVRQTATLNKQLQREAEREHVRQQEAEVDRLNSDIEERIQLLNSLLSAGLAKAGPLNLELLKRQPELLPFDPGTLATPEPAPLIYRYMPPPLRGLRQFWPNAKRAHAEDTTLATQRYEQELEKHAAREAARIKALWDARVAHEAEMEKRRQQAAAWNQQIDQLSKDYARGEPNGITEYCRVVIDKSDYPEEFPAEARIACVPDSKQLVIEYECPLLSVVPEVGVYKYVKTKDEIVPTARSAAQRRTIYTSVVAQTTIRTLHELFKADTSQHLESIVFNGHVTAIDKGTGQQVHPCIVTVRVTRESFSKLNLAQVDPHACLKALSASVSPNPGELAPVRPVLEFNMVDPRFVEEADVLTTLDQRPNLMQLSPTEFESLITNLFEKMGLETRQTQASRDGGVDCVAYDPRPIFGGKVIIQAKRYKNTVGVSAVRDLFGTLQNEGASKGILVTTSGYGRAAFEFADGKPLELLSGSHLLYLLEQHAGVKARIEPPDTWRDPAPDAADT
jgi:restriction system protein